MIWIEIKLLGREPLTLLMGLAFPILLLVLLAGSFGNEPDPVTGLGDTDFYVPVYMSAAIAVMGFLGIPTHLAGYRERGVLRRFRASGVSAAAIMAAQVVVTALLTVTGAAAMAAIGFAAYDLRAPASVVGVVAGFLVGTLAFAAIGVFLGSIMPTARAAQGFGLLMFFGLFFIAGGGPPPYMLPGWVNTTVDLTPMGPLVAAVSDPWHGGGWNATALLALTAIGLAVTIFANRRLKRI